MNTHQPSPVFKINQTPSKFSKERILRTIRNISIAVIILIILFLIAGVIYVKLSGQKLNNTSGPVSDKASQAPHIYKPAQPSPNAAEGVAIISLSTPVKAGENSAVSIQTNAGSTCRISVTYKEVASKDSGLVPKTADAYGSVSWAWTVGDTTPVGKWPVKVTCVYHKKSGVVIGDLVVTN